MFTKNRNIDIKSLMDERPGRSKTSFREDRLRKVFRRRLLDVSYDVFMIFALLGCFACIYMNIKICMI